MYTKAMCEHLPHIKSALKALINKKVGGRFFFMLII